MKREIVEPPLTSFGEISIEDLLNAMRTFSQLTPEARLFLFRVIHISASIHAPIPKPEFGASDPIKSRYSASRKHVRRPSLGFHYRTLKKTGHRYPAGKGPLALETIAIRIAKGQPPLKARESIRKADEPAFKTLLADHNIKLPKHINTTKSLSTPDLDPKNYRRLKGQVVLISPDALRAAIKARNLSIEKIAKTAGISWKSIYTYLKKGRISLPYLEKLSRALGVSQASLMPQS